MPISRASRTRTGVRARGTRWRTSARSCCCRCAAYRPATARTPHCVRARRRCVGVCACVGVGVGACLRPCVGACVYMHTSTPDSHVHCVHVRATEHKDIRSVRVHASESITRPCVAGRFGVQVRESKELEQQQHNASGLSSERGAWMLKGNNPLTGSKREGRPHQARGRRGKKEGMGRGVTVWLGGGGGGGGGGDTVLFKW